LWQSISQSLFLITPLSREFLLAADLRLERKCSLLGDCQTNHQDYKCSTTANRYIISAVIRVVLLAIFLCSTTLAAEDVLTQYELLAPESHQFAIRYDVSATEAGSSVYFNIIRPGSEASNEKVLDRATGKEIPFEESDGKEARAAKQADADTNDQTPFIKVLLPHPVPKDGEFRLRILKTYKDAKSYYAQGDKIIFDRSLGIKRNVIILPAGYELVASTVPVIVSTEEDGRVKVSLINDRDDEVAVRLEGRKLKAGSK
jgi:hypothetical protein